LFTEALFKHCRESGLELNAEKTQYMSMCMSMSRPHNAEIEYTVANT